MNSVVLYKNSYTHQNMINTQSKKKHYNTKNDTNASHKQSSSA